MFLEAIIAVIVLSVVYRIIKRKRSNPNYEGKTVWITGGSSGLGEYLTYEFNRCGAHVIISARNQSELERVKDACLRPEKVTVVKLDMTDFDTVRAVTTEVIKNLENKGQKLDVVVENAGVSMRCEFKDYSFKNHIQMFDVNVHGVFNHIQCFIDHMIKHKSGQIVGISSVAGKLATAYRSSYAGSKHAINGILDSLRTEFHPYGITVTNIMPGYVKTNISKNAFSSGAGEKFQHTDKNIEKGLEPDVFAKEAVQAIYNKESELQISGKLWIPLSIIMRGILPDLAFYGLRKNAKNQSKAIIQGKKEN